MDRRCRGTIRDVAEDLRLDWQTVKRLEMDYMREQIRRVGTPGPKVIGIDESSIRKGHTYRIVVSDFERRRPIWFGLLEHSVACIQGHSIKGVICCVVYTQNVCDMQ